jgi:tetratricopeptide (TPR) repeat protein
VHIPRLDLGKLLEVTSIKDGFLKAWEVGAKEWRESDARGLASLYSFADAGKKYEPVGFSATTATLSLPSDSALAAAFSAEVKKLVDREIATQVAGLQAQIKKDGGKPESVNKLGVLYAKYGLTTEAKAEFSRTLKTAEYVPALVNLGNLAFLTGDAKKALGYYERAQKKEPQKAAVLLGIARANHELENYGKVQEAYAKLKTIDSELASQRDEHECVRGSSAREP